MSKKSKATPTAKDWKPFVVQVLPWVYLTEFTLRQISYIAPSNFPLGIYSFLMWLRGISPMTTLSGVTSLFTNLISFSLLNGRLYVNGQWLDPNGPAILNFSTGILAISVEAIFILGLFKKWRFSWIILSLTAILGILKSYGIVGMGGGNIFMGVINNYLILSLLLLFILFRVRNYYK